ncbi:MAG: NADH-quinone oxidoreductase subunit N [Dehalococcoidia bacterium]|nr:NADH-quinone oxidoreductase subunit N [Dehalococcoidia bacterium]
MNFNDIYLLSPQISIAGLAILTILVDLVVARKKAVMLIALIGLIVPLGFALSLVYGFDASNDVLGVDSSSILSSSFSLSIFSLYFNFLVLGALAIVVAGSSSYVRDAGLPVGEYFGLLLLSASGMMLLVSAENLITIYIALELTTLPLAALSAIAMNGKSTESGIKFLIVSALSSAVMLYGMAFIYGLSGSITLEGISAGLSSVPLGTDSYQQYGVLLGVILLLVGFGFKLSAAPFHMWVPDVYEGSPTPVVAFLSVASKAVAFALVLRFFYVGLGDLDLNWVLLFAVISAVSMSLGNLLAISQTNIKRLFGYSTIAHAGYILTGVAAMSYVGDSSIGVSSVLFYLVAYASANLTALLAISQIGEFVGSDEIDSYAGLSKQSPFLTVALVISLIALIGVPPTGIFIAKIYVFTAAVDSGLMWLAVVGVINSVVSAYYYVRVIRVMFRSNDNSRNTAKINTGVLVKLAIVVSALVTVWLGTMPSWVMGVAEMAAVSLVNVVN